MKILYLNPLILFPPLQGNQMTGLNRVKTLSAKHKITLICFYTNRKELQVQLEKLKEYCDKIIPVYLPKWKSVLNVLIGFFFSKQPLQLWYYRSGKMKNIVNKAISENYDIIHVNTLRMEQFVNSNMKNALLIDLHDSMVLNVQSRVKKEKGIYRYLYTLELKRIKKYEAAVVKNYRYLSVVADQDKEIYNNSKISVVHLGVDMAIFKRYLPFKNNKTLIFSGNMSYTPNVDAVTWFIENCWQNILRKVPQAKFEIVGANPAKQLDKYHNYSGVCIVGKVVSMAEAINQTQIAIAPLNSGSGMQNKILEAMACSVPVVCTTIGLGNIKALNEESIFVADRPDQFSQYCIELLESEEKCKYIGANALSVIKNFYSIQYHCEGLEKLYQKIIFEK